MTGGKEYFSPNVGKHPHFHADGGKYPERIFVLTPPYHTL